MPAGYPVKVNYLTGDVLTAADLNDLAGTVNLYDPTAKGDLFPATAADTVSRLAVGANATVLTADSTTATGLKWAAAGASLDNYTLINTGGTALTGATTITVSGISGKNSLLILTDEFSTNNTSAQIHIRFNSDSGTNYSQSGLQLYGTATIKMFNQQDFSQFWVAQQMDNIYAGEYLRMIVHGAGSTGYKFVSASTAGDTDSTSQFNTFNGSYKGTSAITSVNIISTSGNFDKGTIYIYGA